MEALAKAAAVAKKSALSTHELLQEIKIMFPLTPPKQLTFLISVVLAVAPHWGVLAPDYSAIWCSLPETCLKERRTIAFPSRNGVNAEDACWCRRCS